jgi:hypothetical protein
MSVYDLYGLRVRTALELSAPVSLVQSDVDIDLDVSVDSAATHPVQRPTEDVVAELVIAGDPKYTICATPDGYTCRFHRLADLEFSADLRKLTCRSFTTDLEQYLPLLLASAVPAMVLMLRGDYVLHASAVARDNVAVAFAGQSGAGKSTVAAAMCTQGWRLVTDDVLPMRVVEGQVSAVAGASHLRLRPKAIDLASSFDPHERLGFTVDDRLAVAPEHVDATEVDVAAIVLPVPDRSVIEVSVEPLRPSTAGFELSRLTRIENWSRPSDLRNIFMHATAIAGCIPVVRLRMPWSERGLSASMDEVVEAVANLQEPAAVL